MSKLILSDAPSSLSGPVKAWREAVVIPSYLPLPADKNPMFLEKRVYQGSSGRVYPLPFTDRISEEKVDQSWDAWHIENEQIRVMILPQIGGRIHVGLDKSNGYDFFYRQNVIKPALVGLAGPWISGGVEFNWPQHHRPSTFMPVDVSTENHADGSITIWCSEHEPMNRMKGMHGICIHPGRSVIELKARLYNRTELMQTFLWWANVATRVHEKYQSFFPPDISYVADHAKRAMSRFPLCAESYYGINYGKRAREGVPAGEMPAEFIPPPGEYAANDLSWYANIPVPTSYMMMGSREDFFGGYDHGKQAGLVHFANRHIAPGKKQWTWGNHEFGYAWDRNLTDDDGPYIELMAGVYTDNQPDFSFLHPGETRTFSQFWYPIQKIGPAHQANVNAAISLLVKDEKARIGVATSTIYSNAIVRLESKRGAKVIAEFRVDLSPGQPLVKEIILAKNLNPSDLRLSVFAADGRSIIEYSPLEPKPAEVPAAATEPALPGEIQNIEELYLTGLHLEQYRHATRSPDDYWHEALRRDPSDSRCNNAMGLWHLRRGEFEKARSHFQTAIATLTRRNPNPIDGESYYNLGLALRYLGRDIEAYDAFYKSTWNYAWQSAAFYALAELDCRNWRWTSALDHLDRTLRVNAGHLQARNLKAIVLRKLGRAREADELLMNTLALDPLDFWAIQLSGRTLDCDNEIRLDLAIDHARAGMFAEAIDLLKSAPGSATPLLQYHLGYLHERAGDPAAAKSVRIAAMNAPPDYCFPARLADIAVLQSAISADAKDARAPYYLGNLLYDRRRHEEAIDLWERSAGLNSSFSIVWRNLGIGYFNIRKNPAAARSAYDKALAANPRDARLLYERDQLWKRMGEVPSTRLAELEKYPDLVRQRDDLVVELCALYNQTGQSDRAAEFLSHRKFQPWEGGEGLALGQHVRSQLLLGRRALERRNFTSAINHFRNALASPDNLGEAKHLLANQSDVHYWLGRALDAAGDRAAAANHFALAAESRGDFQEMSVRLFSEMTFYSAAALKALGKIEEANKLLRDLEKYADELKKKPVKIDYFATSLPAMLLFDEDLKHRQEITAKFLAAQSQIGIGEISAARTTLAEVLKRDPNHSMAADFLADLQQSD